MNYLFSSCATPSEFNGVRHVTLERDPVAGWLVNFPDSPSAGPYELRETASGYAAGSTSAIPGVPIVGWSVDCSTGLTQMSGISGDCTKGTQTQFSGQVYECSLWVDGPSGSHFIGSSFFVTAKGTCRENPTYQFKLTGPELIEEVVQDFSSANRFDWHTATEMAGNYTFTVTVRSEGTPDESVSVPYYLIPPP